MKERMKALITMGDPAGIGAEIIVKALAHKEVYERCIPVVIGDGAALRDALEFCGSELELREIQSVEKAQGQPGVIDLIDLKLLKKGDWNYKENSAVCGEASFRYVTEGIRLAMENRGRL